MADSRPREDERRAAAVDLARRLDPDDTMRQAEQIAGFIDNPLVRLLLSLSPKRPRDLRQQAQELRRTTGRMRQLLDALPDMVLSLAPLGWCVTGTTSPTDIYAQAAELVSNGNPEAAENLLVETWNQPGRLRTVTARLKTLYAADDERRHHRWRHLDQALRCHEAGLYAGSVTVLLSLLGESAESRE